jgi:hypothetical protein
MKAGIDDVTTQSAPSTTASEKKGRRDEFAVESPEEFYHEFTRRPDVREILTRLANWQPTSEDHHIRERDRHPDN